MVHDLFFPNLEGVWKEVNLDEWAEKENASLYDPFVQEELIKKIHKELKCDYSYGGYMEFRVNLLIDQYNASIGPDHFWHLGIDYNVPASIPVSIPLDGKLLHSEIDPDQDGGWGGKLIFETKGVYLILGHLCNIVIEKKDYKKGEIVGKVGNYPENGCWFPHLHVQCCKTFDPKVDGYSKDIENFPNPEIIFER